MKIDSITQYQGIFKGCTVESNHMMHEVETLSVFDRKKQFVGCITDQGFALNEEYPHEKEVAVRLAEKEIPFWHYQLSQDLKMQEFKDQLPEELEAEPEIEPETESETEPETEAEPESIHGHHSLPEETPF